MTKLSNKPTVRKIVQDALFNHPVKEVSHEHNTLVLVLNAGYELEISAEYNHCDETAELHVDLFKNERTHVGNYQV